VEPSNNSRKTIHANQFWYPLDNAAKIYPATLSNEVTTVFRLTAALKQPVKIMALMAAVSKAEGRFPYYKVQLKKGFFWFFLEHAPMSIPVMVDDIIPCRKFAGKGPLIRVLVKENRVSVEFSHILTDGTGALEFLKSILALYAKEIGKELPASFSFLQPGEDVPEEEYEDAYNRYFKEKIPPMVKRSNAFHLPFGLKHKPRFTVRKMYLSISSLKPKAAEWGVSITDYLVAVYLYSLQEIAIDQGTKKRPLRVQVPVNLRNILPSRTMRNFSLFVLPGIDTRLGHYTFAEIVKTVYHQIRLETDEKLINKNISRNVGSEKKLYIKSIPLFIKSMILRVTFHILGTSQYSGVITNLGKVKFPDEIEHLVDHFVFTPPPPNKMLKINCGIIGHGDALVLSFGNITKSTELEEKFTRFLEEQGVGVKVSPYAKALVDNGKLV
jgi:NRPS condensation-like uncharacterized protein